MVLVSSGTIKLSNIKTEFSGVMPTYLSSYYTDNSSKYTLGVYNMPSSGSNIKFSYFMDNHQLQFL